MTLKLRNKTEINTLDVLSVDLDVVNGIHAICNTPMFAGQTIKPYYYGEHSCYIYDYIDNNFDELIERFSVDNTGRSDYRVSLLDLTKKQILLFSLIKYMAYPFLLTSIEKITNFRTNNSRILGAFHRGVGNCYDDYIKCKKLISYADKEVQKSIDFQYYNKDARYMFHNPVVVGKMFITRFNKVAPFSLYMLSQFEIDNQLLTYLPTIKMH